MRCSAPRACGTTAERQISEAVSRGHRYADKAKKVMFNPIGQIVGRVNESRAVKDVVQGLVQEYLDAVERLQAVTVAE